MFSLKCIIRTKGGGRCNKPCLKGKSYCKDHTPSNKPAHTFAVRTYTSPEQPSISTTYQDYLNSDEWKQKAGRERLKNPRCSLCNQRDRLHVHHRTYKNIGDEQEGDLVVLCANCHELFHLFYEYDGQSGQFSNTRKIK